MRLKASYNAMSDVPTGYEGAYTEKDGKAVFSGGEFEFKTEAEYNEVHKAKKSGFDELHKVKEQLKAFEGIDPTKYKELVEELDVLRVKAKDGGSSEEEIAEIVKVRVARATEELTNSNKELQAQVDDLKGFKSKTEKNSILDEELSKHVSKEALPDAKFIIGSVIERQADGSFLSNGEAGFEKGLTVDKLIVKAIESRPHWKKQNTPGHGGGGANGGGALNKRTQLMELIEKNRKGELSRTEQKQMTTLAAEIKAERKGNLEK